jgi:hypothetical protein
MSDGSRRQLDVRAQCCFYGFCAILGEHAPGCTTHTAEEIREERERQLEKGAARLRQTLREQRSQAGPDATIEEIFARRVSALGGEVLKVDQVGRRGAPDRFVLWPSKLRGSRAAWVVFQEPGVPLQGHQLIEHDRMRRMGQRVIVIHTVADVEALLP